MNPRYIDELNNSRSAFNLAEEQFAAKDYPNAMDSYRRVIDRDKNYNDAQAKLTEAVELYKGDLFTALTDMENNEMFEDIISRLNAALVVLPDDDEIASNITYYNDFVQFHHRHHSKVRGCKFCIAAVLDEKIVGVAITGRPLSRYLDDGRTAEVTRLCTDGTPNACSFLYAACSRIARSMGYGKIITYILKSETGVSLRA